MRFIMGRRRMTKKNRKHSGRYTPRLSEVTMKYDDIKIDALEPSIEFDEWSERRDGMRDFGNQKEKNALSKYRKKILDFARNRKNRR